ncbi:MAG: translation initiation factor eIF-2B [Ktedonobacterales bacterium]
MGQPDGSSPLPAPLADAIELVKHDRDHGASWLARQVAQALAAAGVGEPAGEPAEQRLQRIHQAARAFADARPSMAALANTATRIWWAGAPSAAPTADPQARLARIHDEAVRLLSLWHNAADAILAAARPLLSGRLFTHSRSGTVEDTLVRLVQMDPTDAYGQPRHIIVSESRPGGEGIPAAEALVKAGWRVTLVPDAAYALFIAGADTVVFGADSIRADGSVVNKVGSHTLALAAHATSVPVYVLCETLKIAAPDAPLTLEEMDPSEILPHPIPGVTPRNVYFERVPTHLITGIITERGRLTPADIAATAAQASQARAALAAGD